MIADKRHWWKWIAGALLLGGATLGAFRHFDEDREALLVSANGRIEATEIDVAARIPGRVKEILVREGDFVTAGQAVALMDTEALEAQLREAEARLEQTQSTAATARSQLVQREAEKRAALAVVAQCEAALKVAQKHLVRSSALAAEEVVPRQQVDDDQARVESSRAAVAAAQAQVAAAEAAVITARTQIAGSQSNIAAAQAIVERLRADIADGTLRAPREGRVQYRVCQPGEVLGGGGRVLSLLDVSDVYMTFFLPTVAVGKVALGTEVRLVVDAAPQFVFPAYVSFVADVAQFTPKTVETANEREKLMFRVRARIPADLLKRYMAQVKTGLPGVTHVWLDPASPWPDRLKVRLPQ